MSEEQDFVDPGKWWRKIRAHPILATISVAVLVCVGGTVMWAQGRVGALLDGVWSWCCSSDEPDVAETFEVRLSTQVPHCQTGNLPKTFSGWSIPVSLEGGAERLVVCTDMTIAGTTNKQEQLLLEVGTRLRDCLSVEQRDDRFIVTPNLESTALCRVPYRFNDAELVEATMPQGLYVCMPGHVQQQTAEFLDQNGQRVFRCDEDALREYGFLQR